MLQLVTDQLQHPQNEAEATQQTERGFDIYQLGFRITIRVEDKDGRITEAVRMALEVHTGCFYCDGVEEQVSSSLPYSKHIMYQDGRFSNVCPATGFRCRAVITQLFSLTAAEMRAVVDHGTPANTSFYVTPYTITTPR